MSGIPFHSNKVWLELAHQANEADVCLARRPGLLLHHRHFRARSRIRSASVRACRAWISWLVITVVEAGVSSRGSGSSERVTTTASEKLAAAGGVEAEGAEAVAGGAAGVG